MHRLYIEQTLGANSQVRLEGDRAHYLCSVLRCRKGELLWVFDGQGGEYQARLRNCSRREAWLEVGTHYPEYNRARLRISLAVAVARGERMDWAVQKSVELGVAAIQPLISNRCTVRLNPRRADQRQAHWQKIIIGACEQSGRTDIPSLLPLLSLAEWLAGSRLGYVLTPGADQPLRDQPAPGLAVELLVGPEGGLDPDEQQQAERAGLQPVSLGPRVLRNETAAAAGIAALQLLWGDLG